MHWPLLLALLACSGCNKPAPAPAPAPSGPLPPVTVESQGLEADLARTEAFLDTRPTYERPFRVTGLEQVEGLADLSSNTCKACHDAIHAEWTTSVHAQAWIDPQYQKEIAKSGNRWLCLNCHTPLLTQMDRWPVGLQNGDVESPELVENPAYDEALRDEGITCAACHVQGDAIHGPGLGPDGGPSDAPHKVVVDPQYRDGSLCLRCHQAEATYAGKTFVCTFQTGDEWKAGPYDDEGTTCVTCHMPTSERPVVPWGEPKTVARHWWRGAGIPKIAGRYPPPEANAFGLEVETKVEGGELVVDYRNAHAGHMLPSGDPERWVQIDVRFEDDAGPVGEPWQHRIRQEWVWEAPPRKVADNRLAPREGRTARIPVPEGATVAVVEASNHRISKENADYHHLGDYPRSVVVHEERVPLSP